MPLYRGAQAELRRVHREARWVLAGVWVNGQWRPAHRRFEQASARLMQSGLVARADLPDFIAPEHFMWATAMGLAQGLAADVRTAADWEVLRGGQVLRVMTPD